MVKAGVLKAAGFFAVGVAVGGLLVAGLSARASRQFLLTVQLSFEAEEDRASLEAWARHDFGAALGHAVCSSASMHGAAAKVFSSDHSRWSLGFPFLAPILERIIEPNLTPTGEANAQAAALAKVGAIWEQLGQAELAERQFREAARLVGASDAKGMRELGRQLLDQSQARPVPRR